MKPATCSWPGSPVRQIFPRRPARTTKPADAFVCVLQPDATLPGEEHVQYGTFLPSTLSQEEINDLAVDGNGGVVAAGLIASDGFTELNTVVFSLDLRLPVAAFTLSDLGAGQVELDPAASSTSGSTVITAYDWDFGDGDTAERTAPLPAVDHTYGAPGRYSIALTVTNDIGLRRTKRQLFTVSCPESDLGPWTAVDIGAPGFPGSTRIEGNEPAESHLALCAGGELLAGESDQCHFVYREVDDDAVLSAHVLVAEGAGSRWQIGVMLRESLEPTARHAAMLIQRSVIGTPRFRSARRETETTRSTQGATVEVTHAYVRIDRRGDEFIASASTDGNDGSWDEVNRVTIEGFPRHYLAGLVAIGHDASPLAPFAPLSAEVAELNLTGGAAGAGPFLRGDCNDDGGVDIADAVCILNWLFLGGNTPGCLAATNTNGDAGADISDGTYLLNHLFLGGPPPVAPSPECGPGELPADEKTCETPQENCPR